MGESNQEKIIEEKGIDEINELLNHDEVEVRSQALDLIAENVCLVNEETEIILHKLLKDPDDKIRSSTAKLLWTLEEYSYGDERSIPMFTELLYDESPKTRADAVFGIGFIAKQVSVFDEIILPRIIELMEDPDETVRGYTALTLGRIARLGHTDASCLPKFIEMIQEDDEWLINYGLGALERYAEAGLIDPSSIPHVNEILKHEDGDWEISSQASSTLKTFAENGVKDESSVPLLTNLVHEGDPCAGWALAIITSGRGDDENSIVQYNQLLRSPDKTEKFRGLFGIQCFADYGNMNANSIPFINELLLNEDTCIRYRAAYALEFLAGKGVVDESSLPILRDIVLGPDEPSDVRCSACRALASIAENNVGDEEIIPMMNQLLKDPSVEVKSCGADAIDILAREGIVDESSIPLLRDIVHGPDEPSNVRWSACRGLISIAENNVGDKEIISIMNQLLKDPSVEVKSCGVDAIHIIAREGIVDESSIPLLKEIAQTEGSEDRVEKWMVREARETLEYIEDVLNCKNERDGVKKAR